MSDGTAWDGLVSLEGDDLHFSLRAGAEEETTEFDIPLRQVESAEFQRGLVNRKLALRVGSEEVRNQFPAGISGDEIHLLVARDDPDFGDCNNEGAFESLAGQIVERREVGSQPGSDGLSS